MAFHYLSILSEISLHKAMLAFLCKNLDYKPQSINPYIRSTIIRIAKFGHKRWQYFKSKLSSSNILAQRYHDLSNNFFLTNPGELSL